MPVTVRDARGVQVSLSSPPKRIVSLVPSTTETLFLLGLGSCIVGRTRFCVHPQDELKGVPCIGGTKDVDTEAVLALRPDLVLGNCEENTVEIFEHLQPHVPLFTAFPKSVDDALCDLRNVGFLTHRQEKAERWHETIHEARKGLQINKPGFQFVYLIWRQPYMTVSDDTFIASMLRESGGTNQFAHSETRFPTVDPKALGELRDTQILLSSEPFPFKERHREELQTMVHPSCKISFVDGELCSWHGIRMWLGLHTLAHWRHEWPQSPTSSVPLPIH